MRVLLLRGLRLWLWTGHLQFALDIGQECPVFTIKEGSSPIALLTKCDKIHERLKHTEYNVFRYIDICGFL